MSLFLVMVALTLGLSGSLALAANENDDPVPLTLDKAVECALSKYPAVRAVIAQAAAATAATDLARTAYLPRLDLVWQTNRATRNNVFGLVFPQPLPLPISGPVLNTNSATSVWGTGTGVLFTWEPFDFGLRKAGVDTARAIVHQANANIEVTRLDVSVTAADAFLTLLASEQAVRVAQASVYRASVLLKTVDVLVKSDLRPGADASRALAELASAKTQLIQAQQREQVSRATLAQVIGMAGAPVAVRGDPFLQLPPSGLLSSTSPAVHPFAAAQAFAIDSVKAREMELNRSYFPRFDFQVATFGRGSGALTNGQVLGGTNGLWPNTFNWAIGMTAKFQVFDFASIRNRREIEKHNEAVENARLEKVIQDLTGERERARAEVDGARHIAEQTPIQLEAAKVAERQVLARYQAGLATLVEVADAQRLLAQAEIEDSLARLRVWRALLGLASSRGDLEPFLAQIRAGTGS